MSPTLSDDDERRLLERPTHVCPECKREVALDYCNRCDLYYSAGHARDCRMNDDHPHTR